MTSTDSASKFVKQWVSSVLAFSSEYNSSTWSSNKVIGPPLVYPSYGDLQNSWAQGSHSANEFIELQFPKELIVSKLNIYETFHAGSIVRIELKNKDWEIVYGPVQAQDIGQSRIFSPELRVTRFKTDKVRLTLDCSRANTWCEIDAIEMEGKLPIDANQCEQDLANDLRKLLVSKDFFDVEFEIEGKIMGAHRNILAARSKYFKSLLCENLKPNRLSKPIHIERMSFEAFNCLLVYLYTNRIESNTKPVIVCELMRNGDTYSIETLNESCINYIEDILDNDNIIDIYKNSSVEEPEISRVKELCLKFITRHFQNIIQKQEFKDLPQKSIISITQYYAKNRA